MQRGYPSLMPKTKNSAQDQASPRSGKFEFDLTRQCHRSGAVQLPGSMLGLFEGGEVDLRDSVSDKSYVLTFTPPRLLGGLGEFFEQHSLEPNDKIIVVLGGQGGEIKPLKRPVNKAKESDIEGESTIELPETTSELIVDGPVQVREVRRRKEPEVSSIPLFAAPEMVHNLRRNEVPKEEPAQQFDDSEDSFQDIVEPILVPVEHNDLSPEQSLGFTEQIMSFLLDPATPTIIRVEDVSEQLQLPGDSTLETFERLSQDPDSGLVFIRPGVYRMNRPVPS